MEKAFNPALGDLDAFWELNKRLVYKAAQRYISAGLKVGYSREDLESIGIIGFIKAYKNFNPELGRFSTYAYPMIQGEILRVVRDSNVGVKFSRDIKEASRKVYNGGLSDESPGVISEKLGMDFQLATDALIYSRNILPKSLHSISYDNGNEEALTYMDQLPYEDDLSIVEVNEFLRSLSEKERIVAVGRYKEVTQKEIGKTLGVSQVQVSRIEKKVKAKAKLYFKDWMVIDIGSPAQVHFRKGN